jgi:hypothetical protein
MATFWRGATSPRGASRVARLKQSERDFRQQVVQLAQLRGWLVYWTWTSIHSPAGFPDLVLCRPAQDGRPGRIVFAELKTATGKVTLAQQEWLAALGACTGVEAALWRPADWLLIDATLA